MKPKKPKWGLRARLLAAMLTVVAVPAAGFYLAMHQFTEILEAELLHERLAEELREFVQAYRYDPSTAASDDSGIARHVVRPGQAAALPPDVLALQPGLHADIHIAGREYYVGREDVGEARLYLLLDMQPVEALEARLVTLAWTCVLIALAIATVLALVLARRVTRPVTAFADLVARLDPGEPRVNLSASFADRDVGIIAAAFDRFLERLDEFVQRERTFTEDASHELRTPLAVVRSAVELLRDDASLSPAARERVSRIARACAHMQDLIEALLVLAREDPGTLSTACPMDEVVREVVHTRQEAAREMAVDLNLRVAEPQMVRAAPGLAASVVANLVANAIHHTAYGVVEVSLERGRLSVLDTGSGIPAEDLARIFERRYRGTRSSGQGLGLYLVKRICDRLGWNVEVQSTPRWGTRVDVTFSPVA